MSTFNQADLLQLAQASGDHLVSLYMPMHTGAQFKQNPVRYKNLASAAEKQLIERGIRSTEARKRIDSISKTLDDANVWGEQGPSLAVFASAESTRFWRIPMDIDEQCVVGDMYRVVPLVTWLSDDAPYFVLAVSQNEVKFYRAQSGSIEELNVPDLPTSRQDALRLDDPEPARQQHAAARGTPDKQGLVFHGQGGAPDDSKQEILNFFREIDRSLEDALRQRNEPLIFAGVDYLFPLFQEASSYKHLHSESVDGNPELWSPEELRERSWPLVKELLQANRQSLLEAYGNSIPLGQAIDRVEEVILAAHAGAVDTLFIDPNAQISGAFDAAALQVTVDENPREESEDLLNLATVLVLRSSGNVAPVDSNEVPGEGKMAATLRYPFPASEAKGREVARHR